MKAMYHGKHVGVIYLHFSTTRKPMLQSLLPRTQNQLYQFIMFKVNNTSRDRARGSSPIAGNGYSKG